MKLQNIIEINENKAEEEKKLDYAFTIVPDTITLPPKSGIVF